MVLVHHHGDVGIGLGCSEDQVTQENLTCIAACSA